MNKYLYLLIYSLLCASLLIFLIEVTSTHDNSNITSKPPVYAKVKPQPSNEQFSNNETQNMTSEPSVDLKVMPQLSNKKDSKTENISKLEVRRLILEGKYEHDPRIAKDYKIEFLDVCDDDIEVLQQDLACVKQQIEFGNWKDFKVIEIEFSESRKVNLIKIQPIY